MDLTILNNYTPNRRISWNGVENKYIVFRDSLILSAYNGSTLIYELTKKNTEDVEYYTDNRDNTIFEGATGFPYYLVYDPEKTTTVQSGTLVAKLVKDSSISSSTEDFNLTIDIPLDGTYRVVMCGGGGGNAVYANQEATGGNGGAAVYSIDMKAGKCNIRIGKRGIAVTNGTGSSGGDTFVGNYISAYGGTGGTATAGNTGNGNAGTVNDQSGGICNQSGDASLIDNGSRATLALRMIGREYNYNSHTIKIYEYPGNYFGGEALIFGTTKKYLVYIDGSTQTTSTYSDGTDIDLGEFIDYALIFGLPIPVATTNVKKYGGGYLLIQYMYSK